MWIGGVRVIILDSEKRLLMVRQHHDGKDIWMVPGGAIEDGENSIEAAEREMREETCLDVEIGKLIWHTEEVSSRGQRFVNFFLGHVKGGTCALGTDPELDENHQVMDEIAYKSRSEVEKLEHVYPEYLRDELWEALEGERDRIIINTYKIRK